MTKRTSSAKLLFYDISGEGAKVQIMADLGCVCCPAPPASQNKGDHGHARRPLTPLESRPCAWWKTGNVIMFCHSSVFVGCRWSDVLLQNRSDLLWSALCGFKSGSW